MDQDIIERKPASPIATSLLVISAACMLAAMIFMFVELRELKGDATTPTVHADSVAKIGRSSETAKLRDRVQGVVVDDADPGDGDGDADGDGDGDADGDGDGGGDGGDGDDSDG